MCDVIQQAINFKHVIFKNIMYISQDEFLKRSLKLNTPYLYEFELECSWIWKSEAKTSSSSSSLSRLSSESYSALLWEGGRKG